MPSLRCICECDHRSTTSFRFNSFVLTALSSILSPQSHTQSAAFATALLFAQDYGMLAASLQDRPFIPVSTVVLEGAPRDMRAVFRWWKEAPDAAPPVATERLMSGKPANSGRKVSGMKTVGLASALVATQK